MGEASLIICKDCQVTEWLEDYELPEFIQEHSGHRLFMLPRGWPEDDDELVEGIWALLGWEKEGG